MNFIFQTLKIFLKICFHSYNIYNSSNKGYMTLTNLCLKHIWANFNRFVCVHMCAVVLGITPRSLSILSKDSTTEMHTLMSPLSDFSSIQTLVNLKQTERD